MGICITSSAPSTTLETRLGSCGASPIRLPVDVSWQCLQDYPAELDIARSNPAGYATQTCLNHPIEVQCGRLAVLPIGIYSGKVAVAKTIRLSDARSAQRSGDDGGH
eukprot:1811936-Pyramimonas_sp.AAC.1